MEQKRTNRKAVRNSDFESPDNNSYTMTRTDSGLGEDFDVKRDGGNEGKRYSSGSQSYERDTRHSRPVTSWRPSNASSRDHRRQQSVSTLPSKARRSSGSRSSSISHRRPERPRPGRIHSSPVPTMTNSIDDAIAFHQRSCRMMELFHGSRIASDLQTPQMHHGGDSAYYHFPPSDQPHAYSSTTRASNAFHASITHEAEDEDSQQPVTHWTSINTRRREYAEIDKRNTGLRRWMRRFMPGCMGPDTRDFYCEKDGSDTGSVRRYRMDLADDERE